MCRRQWFQNWLVCSFISRCLQFATITHRIQLGEALCKRFGVNYVTEVRDSGTGDLLGYGVCIDSLHHQSQARFNPNDWHNDTVIIDECDQVFWHLLNSGTEVAKRRVAVLKNLKLLIQNVLGSPEGKIYLASADVSDCDVDYVLSLAGEIQVKPFIIVNDYQPQAGKCYIYKGSNPKDLVVSLDKAIAASKQTLTPGDESKSNEQDESHTASSHLLLCSAQKAKSKWGTQALEERFRRKFPDLKILRIDSESVSDPNHPAYGCIANLNQILTEYDLVIASPSLETGVSIDIQGHFQAVWGIFQGVQSANSVRQMLARLRENVDRHIWVRSSGVGTVGNASTSMGSLLASQHAAPGVMFRGSDAALLKLKQVAVENRYIIKNYLGISVSEGMTPMAIVHTLLDKLGLSLSYVGRLGSRGKRERVYEFVEPKDGRDEIFAKWVNSYGVGIQS
ncbi:plasmid replication protein, CyRepA1 family [Calothrix sp. UHCC 0171]|uniref:plasmid replication protein, CyRepA1 family n=1 Tax=Calothrix sp. UHCC 0171 TaxID=3110245 RepID=UPI002B1F70B3|nr:plasmid replication protein, CyRepA1 family [Calothrix sp. UHCC 0171]MEA5573110.1 plasmid replication protein, CyRepA1 family [Calothrix sp. UHCC 0171]